MREDESSPEDDEKKHPPLHSAMTPGTFALVAAGMGVFAVATIALELWTGRRVAALIGIGLPFVSLPLGVGAAILAILSARSSVRYALPALALTGLYWGLAVGAGL